MHTVKKILKTLSVLPLAIIAGMIDNSGSFILMGKDSRCEYGDDAYRRTEGIR